MADKIFLIHGMGHHPDTWSTDVDAKLRELYARYGLLYIPIASCYSIQPV